MKKGLQKTKQWVKDNKVQLAFIGFVASTTVAIGSIVHRASKGEDVTDALNAVEKAVENGHEVRIYLGGLNDEKDAGAWIINMVDEFRDADGNVIQYSMDKIAEDIINGDYKEI